jgi:ribosomal protein S8
MNKVSNVARDAIGSFVGASAKADKTKVKTLDVLQAEGFVSTDFVAPDKGKDQGIVRQFKGRCCVGL